MTHYDQLRSRIEEGNVVMEDLDKKERLSSSDQDNVIEDRPFDDTDT